MVASHNGHVKVVDRLLCNGARVNLQQEVINPRHACAARVTVVCHVCCVCVCVCLCVNHISPLKLLFVVKTLPRTHQTRKVKTFVPFSLKLLCCRD